MPGEIITLSLDRDFRIELDKFCGKNRSEFIRKAVTEKISKIKQEKEQ